MGTRSSRKARNQRLGHWIRQAGVSYADLARELRGTAKVEGRPDIHPDRTRIGHWVNSGEQPRPPLPDLLAATLSRLCHCDLTPADLGLSAPNPSSDDITQSHPATPPAPPNPAGDPTKRRQALTLLGISALASFPSAQSNATQTATVYTRHATATDLAPVDITELELAVHQFGASYSAQPPVELWPVAFQRRREAFELLHHRRHTLREGRELARHAGMLSVILAWLSHDLGNHQATEAFAADAKIHGQQADVPEVCAWADDLLATHALYDDRPLDALAAATRGLANAPRNSPVAVRLTAQLARAHALHGDGAGFRSAADRAHDYQAGLAIASSGLFAVDAVRIISYDASSHIWLGNPAQARAAATAAIQHYQTTAAPTRLSLAQLDLALAYAALGEPEAAIDAGRHALNGNRPVGAITSRARQLDHSLRRRYLTLPEVHEFHEQVRTLHPAV